jgi:hypothetical protein
VVEKGFQPYGLDVKDAAKKLEAVQDFAGYTKAAPDLTWKKARFQGLFFLTLVSGGPTEEGIPAFLVHMGLKSRRFRIIDNDEIPFELLPIRTV